MEKYEGIKFKTKKLAHHFTPDTRLSELNYWISVFADLGLAPLHPEGAYGNHSYRLTEDFFVITRTGMIPSTHLNEADYCLVSYDKDTRSFLVKGQHEPSSESYLHSLIYTTFPKVKVVMHGHSTLLNMHADKLGIEVTVQEFPYGTMELAQSALLLCRSNNSFFIMKNHGFIATGTEINSTATMVLRNYIRTLELLMNEETPE